MLTSPALLSMVSSRSASTRAISTRSAVGALSRPGNTGALLNSRLRKRILARGGRGAQLARDGAAERAPKCGRRRRRRGAAGAAEGAAANVVVRAGFAKSADLRDQRGRGDRQRAVAHQIAHAREFIETGLHDGVRMIVADHGSAVDLDHQGLEFMAQIAHGGDARHSGAAFQGVQLTLQLRNPLLVLAVAIPGGQR